MIVHNFNVLCIEKELRPAAETLDSSRTMELIRRSRSFMNSEKCFATAAVLALAASACLAQPDPNWVDHDRARPLPGVIAPAVPSTQEQVGKAPSDATILFDGKDISQWVSMDGSPTKWIMRDG